MKKLIFLIALITIYQLLFTIDVLAASPSPSSESVSQKLLEQLRDRVASKVAELNLVEKRGLIGKVTDLSQTQITLSTPKDETRFVDVDELTKFEGEEKDFGISDVKKGQSLGVLGLYNKQSRRLLARVVTEIDVPKYITGVVESVDFINFQFTIVTDTDDVFKVDVEKTTKTSSYIKDEGLIRSGFSKIQVAQNVIVSGTLRTLEKNRISADRILIFPEIPKNPKVSIEVIPVSTGSGKKLTPITQ